MKINEKNLYTFANSKPVDKEGKGRSLKNSLEISCKRTISLLSISLISFPQSDVQGFLQFKREMKFQKRWFVLKGNLLFYFDKKGDKEPIGLLLLEGCM